MEILNNHEIIRLTQGNDFDGYDERENNKNRLCNVKPESMKKVKYNQLIEIDFDGYGEIIWHGIVTSKNRNNHTVNVYLP